MADGLTCCFTGYRPYRFSFSPDGLRPEHIQSALNVQIRRLYDEGYRRFITGLCIGVDLWAAEEVLRLKQEDDSVELIGAVPFDGQESRWTLPERAKYKKIRSRCSRVEVLFSQQEARKNPAACYRARNQWMVDRADTLIAVYSPHADLRSGTAATVHYAKRKLKRIIYIHPQSLQSSEEVVHQIEFIMP